MARAVALVSFGIVVGVLGGAAIGLHAQDEPDLGAGVDLTGVDGSSEVAAESTSAEPDLTVESPRVQLTPEPPYGIWDRLANCESGGNWHIDAYHDGGLQFLPSTWTTWKLQNYPPYAWQATRGQQIETAIRLQRAAGWGQWPACSRRLGLR